MGKSAYRIHGGYVYQHSLKRKLKHKSYIKGPTHPLKRKLKTPKLTMNANQVEVNASKWDTLQVHRQGILSLSDLNKYYDSVNCESSPLSNELYTQNYPIFSDQDIHTDLKLEVKSLKFRFVLKAQNTFKRIALPKAEKMTKSLTFWIPRSYREAIRGDILEDCEELRDFGSSEWRIRAHVIWQLAIGVMTLLPDAVINKIVSSIRKTEK